MLRIKNYINKFEEDKATLDDLLERQSITPEMVIDNLTPAEKKIVDILGGEAMIYGLVRGNVEVDERGKLEFVESSSNGNRIDEGR